MVRRTSKRVYKKIMSDGVVTKLRLNIYEVLFFNGPLTAGEIWSYFFRNRQRSSISARMSEMQRMGIVYPALERDCNYTGNSSIAWEVTKSLPKKLKKEKIRCRSCGKRG